MKMKFSDQKIFTYSPPVGKNVDGLTIDEAHDMLRQKQCGYIRLMKGAAAKTIDIHECPYCGQHDLTVAEAAADVDPEMAVYCVCGMVGPSAPTKVEAVKRWNVVGKKAKTKAWATLEADL